MTEQLELLPSTIAAGHPEPFRSIHYLGSKLRLVNAINDVIVSLAPGSDPLCDLFSGSGVVAHSQVTRRDVVAVDIQEYSRVLCSALLRNVSVNAETMLAVTKAAESSPLRETLTEAFAPLLTEEEGALLEAEAGSYEHLAAILEKGSVRARIGAPPRDPCQLTRRTLERLQMLDDARAALSATYGGVYFSYQQAIDLDCLLDACHQLDDMERDVAVAAALSTASELVASVGSHFAQPIKPRDSGGRMKVAAMRQVARQREVSIFEVAARWLTRYIGLPVVTGASLAVRADFREFLGTYEGPLSVVYADPPYTRDHYSRFYHVLETMALRDTPRLEGRVRNGYGVSRGLYRHERHQSPFSIKTQAPQAFEDLFEGTRRFDVPLCLSYSPYDKDSDARPRLMTIGDIVSIARRWFRSVRVEPVLGVRHSKLNSSALNGPSVSEAEVLLVCLP